MIDEKTEMREHLDQTQLVSTIYRQFQKCEMNEENELTINVRRGLCFKDFLKTFQKSWNIKRMRNKYSITFIRESGIDTGGVCLEFYSGFVGIFHFFHFSFILRLSMADRDWPFLKQIFVSLNAWWVYQWLLPSKIRPLIAKMVYLKNFESAKRFYVFRGSHRRCSIKRHS